MTKQGMRISPVALGLAGEWISEWLSTKVGRINRVLLRTLVVVSVSSLCTGCGGLLLRKVDDFVAKEFPPVTHDSVKAEALRRSTEELAKIRLAAVLLNVPNDVMSTYVSEQLRQMQSTELQVHLTKAVGEEQGVAFSVEVSGKLENPNGSFEATIHGWVVADLSQHVVRYRPVLESAVLNDLNIYGWGSAEKIAKLVNAALHRYINNVNGQFATIEHKIDPDDLGLSLVPISIPGNPPVLLPGVSLGPATLLLDSTGLHVVAQIDLVPRTSKAEPRILTFDAFRDEFWRVASAVREPPDQMAAGIYLSNQILGQLLGPAFPPVKFSELQEHARMVLATSLQSLEREGRVAGGVTIESSGLAERLQPLVDEALDPTDGIAFGPSKVSLGDQAILFEVPVTGVSQYSQIAYVGKLHGGAVLAPESDGLYYRLAIIGLTLDSVRHLGGRVGVSEFVISIETLIAQLVPHINASFEKERVVVPIPDLVLSSNPSNNVSFQPPALPVVEGDAVRLLPRVKSEGIRVLIVEAPGVNPETASVTDLPLLDTAQLVEGLEKNSLRSVRANARRMPPGGVDALFDRAWSSNLPVLPPSGFLTAILSIPWAVDAIDRAVRDEKLRVNFNASGTERFDSGRLELKVDHLKCQPRSCSRNSCPLAGCSRNACSWDCRRCGWLGCFDDPFCKAGEAACNVREEASRAACNLRAEADRAACNLKEEAQLGVCNAQRNAEELFCNAYNEVINALQKINGIGTITGDVTANARAQMSDFNLTFDAASDSLQLNMLAEASVIADGKVSFTPYDIGHVLVCPIQGALLFDTHAILDSRRMNLVGKIAAQPLVGDELKISLGFQPVKILGRLSPSPYDALFSRNPQIFVTCSPFVTAPIGAIGVLGKVSAFTPLDVITAIERAIPDSQEADAKALQSFVSGDYEQEFEVPVIEFTLEKLTAEVAGQPVVLFPAWSSGFVIYATR